MSKFVNSELSLTRLLCALSHAAAAVYIVLCAVYCVLCAVCRGKQVMYNVSER